MSKPLKSPKIVLVLTVVAIFISTNSSFAGGTIKLGFDLPGDHKVSAFGVSGTEDVETGFSITGEFFGAINNYFELGGGLTWQFPRSQDEYEGDFYFVPIYGMMRIRSDSKTAAPYFIGQIGYNLIFDGDSKYKGSGAYEADLEGGLYYGLGGGAIINEHFLVEILYSVNDGTGDILGMDFDVEYSKFSILVGYNF